nr:hypothetical protein [Acetobacter nitrogenifigens]
MSILLLNASGSAGRRTAGQKRRAAPGAEPPAGRAAGEDRRAPAF